MKLITTPASPFGRIVRVAAEELGVTGRIQVVVDNPWNADTRVPNFNPVGKVPILLTDGGEALFDSRVIVEYLDAESAKRRMFPEAGPARWSTLTRASLADQMLDAFIAVRLEGRRPLSERSENWMLRQGNIVRRCLNALEQRIGEFESELSIAHVTLAVALGHLDFRQDTMDLAWREGRPRLQRWYDTFAGRESMRSTQPHD